MTTTLVTGATRGIGLETARQLVGLGRTVYVGARGLARGRATAAAVGARAVQLDVTDEESVTAALVRVTEAALPLLRRSASPAVVTVSSSMGSSRAVTTTPGGPGRSCRWRCTPRPRPRPRC